MLTSEHVRLQALVAGAVDETLRLNVDRDMRPQELDGLLYTAIRRALARTSFQGAMPKRKKYWRTYSPHVEMRNIIMATVRQRLRDTLFLSSDLSEPETPEECLESVKQRLGTFEHLVEQMRHINKHDTPALAQGVLDIHNIFNPDS